MTTNRNLTTNQRAVLVTIEAHGGITDGEISHETGVSARSVARALWSLTVRGWVTRSQYGRYHTTLAGHRRLLRSRAR